MESIHWHGREACKAYRVIRRADRMLRKKRWFPELLRWTQSPWKYFSMKEDFLPLLESTIFSKEKFIDPFLLSVIRPRRKTPGSPSTEDGGHNNCGIPTFLTKHGDKPLQSHQDIRGGGTATDVAPPPSWSKMTSGWILSTLFRSRSYTCRTVLPPTAWRWTSRLPRDFSLSLSLIQIQSLNRRTKLWPKTNAFMVLALIWEIATDYQLIWILCF